MSLSPPQAAVLALHHTNRHQPTACHGGQLRTARSLAALGLLAPVDATGRTFAITPAGTAAHDQLTTGVLERSARADILTTRRTLLHHARRIVADRHTSPQTADESNTHHDALARRLYAAEQAYTDRFGGDPYVGVHVTIPETGSGHAWTITDRSAYDNTVELTSATGERHTARLDLDYVLYAAELAAAGLPAHPERTIPADYIVDRDDIGDGQYWQPVAKGTTTVKAISPIDLGMVAREIEQAYRAAGCTGVIYRVTVTCPDGDIVRSVTANTPPPVEPCYCGECPPDRSSVRYLTAVPNPPPVDSDADAIARDLLDPQLRVPLLASLDGFLAALAARLDRRGLTIRIVDSSGEEVFHHSGVA
jgi:hypothetical protein